VRIHAEDGDRLADAADQREQGDDRLDQGRRGSLVSLMVVSSSVVIAGGRLRACIDTASFSHWWNQALAASGRGKFRGSLARDRGDARRFINIQVNRAGGCHTRVDLFFDSPAARC
jgi:hypothetical protein